MFQTLLLLLQFLQVCSLVYESHYILHYLHIYKKCVYTTVFCVNVLFVLNSFYLIFLQNSNLYT